ncbi:MAG: hypothetical protein IT379_15145 [Deltaproteobacteria bacterium]|nr:hypothetical protein [Deltaproteobacteria bacterium]
MREGWRIVFSVAAVAWVAFASASPARASGPSDVAQARSLFEQAMLHAREGRHELACQALEAARSLHDAASIRFNLGVCHRALGHAAEARRHFSAAEALDAVAQPERAGRARQAARELAGSIATLVLGSEEVPRGATVRLDGRAVEISHLRGGVEVDVGRRRVEASAPGFAPLLAEVDVSAGERRTLPLRFVAARTRGVSGRAEAHHPRRGNTRRAVRVHTRVRRDVLPRTGPTHGRTPPEPPLLVERWWFWAGVGTVVVGTVVGVVAATAGSDGSRARSSIGGVIQTLQR